MPCFLTVCVRAYFWKITEFTFPFYQRTAYSGVVYQWCLVLFFSTSQWFGTIEQFCPIIRQYVVVECLFALYLILWMACVFTSKLQVKLSSQFYSWSSITREETFRKFYRNIPYLHPFRLLTSLKSEPWMWQRRRKSRGKNNRILTVESNLHNLRAHALQLT